MALSIKIWDNISTIGDNANYWFYNRDESQNTDKKVYPFIRPKYEIMLYNNKNEHKT